MIYLNTNQSPLLKTFEDYQKTWNQAFDHPKEYWQQLAKQSLVWHRPFDKVLEGDFFSLAKGPIRWFGGGELNLHLTGVDYFARVTPEKLAFYFEPNNPADRDIDGEKITYRLLHEKINEWANLYRDLGLKSGDVVCLYCSMIPDLVYATLACSKLGLVHTVVFGGFSAQALSDRLVDSKAKIIVTNNFSPRGEKMIALKETVDSALEISAGKNQVQKVIVVNRFGKRLKDEQEEMKKKTPINTQRDQWYDEWLNAVKNGHGIQQIDPVIVESEHPLFILYTSGSTGKPKGLLHTTAGYALWAKETFHQVFQTDSPSDVFWCTADLGWITGHSYIAYGPILNGVTQVLFEGIPTFPDCGRFWQVVDHYKVTHFYTAPTAIRSLMNEGEEIVKKSSRSSLKVLGSVGEPINEEAWHWYNEVVGEKRCPIVDTWWQTETGGMMISPLAGVTPRTPSYATYPQPGIVPAFVIGESNLTVSLYNFAPDEIEGPLCLARPWPGLARTIWGDHERYIQTYFSNYPGFYFTGDGAKINRLGQIRILGRIDDVMNVSGHRLGTAELENSINEHEWIVESAVVAIHHDIKGQAPLAFVILENYKCPKNLNLKELEEKLLSEINKALAQSIGPIAKLEKIVIAPSLPKTRSGKIMRRILRKIAEGEKELKNLGDTSTLLNPEVVEILLQRF